MPIQVPLSCGMDMNRWDRKGRILGWVAGVALSVNAVGWVLEDVEVVRGLGNLQSLLEQAGELSYGAFGLVIWWAIFDSRPRRAPVQKDPALGQGE